MLESMFEVGTETTMKAALEHTLYVHEGVNGGKSLTHCTLVDRWSLERLTRTRL